MSEILENQIAQVPENLTLEELYSQLEIPSLGRDIFPVLQMNSPLGNVFSLELQGGNAVLLKKELQVPSTVPMGTSFSQEALQDLEAQFGIEGTRLAATMLGGIARGFENQKTKEFLEAKAVPATALTLTNKNNSKVNVEEISQRVSEVIGIINKNVHITYQVNAVVPQQYANAFSFRATERVREQGNQSYFIARFATADFFVDPDPSNTDAVYVTAIDGVNSGGFFGSYRNELSLAVDPDSGECKYFIFDRFTLTENPRHDVSPLIFKFQLN